MKKQMVINKENIYIKMDEKSTVFYTIIDNVHKKIKTIPANPRKFLYERVYLENVENYLRYLILDHITDNIIKIVFNNIPCYSNFVLRIRMFYSHIGTNITITGNITDEEKDPLCYPEILIEELNIQIENHKKDIELLNERIKFQQKKIILEKNI
jgi:hypothetical protein